jgi:AGZA family xanthine/uracil permease-like MFS transporter
MGGRIGYSAATRIMVIVLSWFGVISLMVALIPVVAIAPILLYIGMLIGSQAFQESPKRHAPAIVLALVPSLAAWGKTQIDNALSAAAGVQHVTEEMIASMAQSGVLYKGLAVVGGGSILSGVILGAIGVYIIDRRFLKAAAFAAAGAVLTFFGLMHGESIGVGESPAIAAAYMMVAAVLFGCHQLNTAPAAAPAGEHEEAEEEHDTSELEGTPAVA